MHILINKKYLIYKNYKVKCAIGKRGIGIKKKEGDLITPKGQYKIKFKLVSNSLILSMKSAEKKSMLIALEIYPDWNSSNVLTSTSLNSSKEKLSNSSTEIYLNCSVQEHKKIDNDNTKIILIL